MQVDDPRIARVTGASLCDAMARRHAHRAHILDLVSPTPGRVMFGRAVTMQLMPRRADTHDPRENNFARMFYSAVGTRNQDGHGVVLVIASCGHEDHSVIGGTKAARLHARGLAGLLTDARARDFHELETYDFTTWCTGETVLAAGPVLSPHSVNQPVALRGTTIVPGDYVYGDAAGVVVIPEADVDAVVDTAIELEEQDAARISRIHDEDPQRILDEGADK